MPALLTTVDPDGLLEYSVVYTDRALNHMSLKFQAVMRDLAVMFKEFYSADHVAIIPGSGTAGMEAVVRQLAAGKKCLSLRNGFFNFRWTQILDMVGIAVAETVLKAKPVEKGGQPCYAPPAAAAVIAVINEQKPDLVFATHVETSAGIILPDSYIKEIAAATHQAGGLFVLDCIASGATWVNMRALGVDILTTAPQKGWSSTPCAGIVLVNDKAMAAIKTTQSNSYFLDLKKWLEIMAAYEHNDHAYHATMPTDSLRQLRDTMREAQSFGLEKLKQNQALLGEKVRLLLADNGLKPIAAAAFAAPSIVVAYTRDPDLKSGKKFAQHGVQVASGVPLKCDEPQDFSTFRLGLLGLDKLANVDRSVQLLADALREIIN